MAKTLGKSRSKPRTTRSSSAKGARVRTRPTLGRSGTPLRFRTPRVSRIKVKDLRTQLGLTRRLFARLANCSERHVAGLENDGKTLNETQRRRMVEIARLQEALDEVMDSSFIADWLNSPNEHFDGLKPLEVIERGEIDRVWELVFYLRSGMPV